MGVHTRKALGLGLVVFAITAGSVLLEVLLDAVGLARYKHPIGNIGTLLVLLSFIYSFRKRKIILKAGNIQKWLKAHELLAVAGTFFIFIHAGMHTHAAVPIISLILIFVAFVSGLVGRYVYEAGRSQLKARRDDLAEKGIAPSEIEEQLKPLIELNRRLIVWRSFHIPLVSALFLFVVFHIISALYYGGF